MYKERTTWVRIPPSIAYPADGQNVSPIGKMHTSQVITVIGTATNERTINERKGFIINRLLTIYPLYSYERKQIKVSLP